MSRIKNIKLNIKKTLSPEECGFVQVYNLRIQLSDEQSSDESTETVSINVKNDNILYKRLYNGGGVIYKNGYTSDDTKNMYFYSCGAAEGRGENRDE